MLGDAAITFAYLAADLLRMTFCRRASICSLVALLSLFSASQSPQSRAEEGLPTRGVLHVPLNLLMPLAAETESIARYCDVDLPVRLTRTRGKQKILCRSTNGNEIWCPRQSLVQVSWARRFLTPQFLGLLYLPEVATVQAVCCIASGDFHEAKRILDGILAQQPRLQAARLYRAQLFAHQGDYASALADLTFPMDEQYSERNQFRVSLLMSLLPKHRDGALEVAERAWATSNRNVDDACQYAKVLYSLSCNDRADEILSMPEIRDHPEALTLRAISMLRRGEIDSAMQCAERALSKCEPQIEAQFIVAFCCYRSSSFSRAKEHLTALLDCDISATELRVSPFVQIGPVRHGVKSFRHPSATLVFLRALVSEGLGDAASVISDAVQAIRVDPSDTAVHMAVASLLCKPGIIELLTSAQRSFAALQVCAATGFSSPILLEVLAQSYWDQGRHTEAMHWQQLAIDCYDGITPQSSADARSRLDEMKLNRGAEPEQKQRACPVPPEK